MNPTEPAAAERENRGATVTVTGSRLAVLSSVPSERRLSCRSVGFKECVRFCERTASPSLEDYANVGAPAGPPRKEANAPCGTSVLRRDGSLTADTGKRPGAVRSTCTREARRRLTRTHVHDASGRTLPSRRSSRTLPRVRALAPTFCGNNGTLRDVRRPAVKWRLEASSSSLPVRPTTATSF